MAIINVPSPRDIPAKSPTIYSQRDSLPLYEVRVSEDLDGLAVVTNGLSLPRSGLIVTNGGTAAALTNTATEVGWQQLRTGTSATGKAFISSSAAQLSYFLSTAAEVYMSFRGGIPTLSNGTEKYNGFMGFCDTPADVDFANACGFYINQTTPVANFMVALGAGSVTPAATGLATVSITAGVNYHLEMFKPAGSDTMNLAIDGTLVHSASVAALAAVALGSNFGIEKNAGTTTTGFNVDWIRYHFVSPQARAASFLV